MQAAFVDIGRDKNAFLYIGDLAEGYGAITVGQEILVQVAKDALGTKGPRVTTHLTLPGRYVVLMPTVEYTGVSRRIESKDERARLRDLAEAIRPAGKGIIVRTVAEGKKQDDLSKDSEYLINLWDTLAARAKRANAPTLLYRDVDLVIRLVRDHFSADVSRFIIDNREAFNRAKDLLEFVSPELVARLELFEGQDVFAHYGIDAEMAKLEQRRVELCCGGYIVIDRTEALTVIDVNTGRFVGHTRLEDTIFQANLEAAAEIARQIRLRDIGGIIIIDFIDMESEEHRQAVLAAFGEQLKRDRTKTHLLGLTGLGLVEMTRKKVRQDLAAVLNSECPCCQGRGTIRSPETVALNVRREIRRLCLAHQAKGKLVIQVHPRVAEVLKPDLERFGRELSCSLAVEAVPAMHDEAFSILKGRE
jgi:ribonuclease G